MRISDWSSDVCSSDLELLHLLDAAVFGRRAQETQLARTAVGAPEIRAVDNGPTAQPRRDQDVEKARQRLPEPELRSEEHTSELQSLMRISYAVFCLKKKIKNHI